METWVPGPRHRGLKAHRAEFSASHAGDVAPSLLVALGGLIGSVGRYWLAGLVQSGSDSPFPLGTLSVNVLGSFVVGLVMALSLDRGLVPANVRLFLATGFCGGFTTMSTFSYETLALVRDGEMLLALGTIGLTLVACLVAVMLGQAAARVL